MTSTAGPAATGPAATGPAATGPAATGPAATGPAAADAAPAGRTAAALQSALAAVNAAIYGYGVGGAQLGTAARDLALRDWTQHEIARDKLEAMLTSLGVRPAAAQPAYQLPFPVHGTRAAISLAGYLEDRVAAAYLGIVALDDPRLRAWGAAQARACALRATAWLGRTTAFPGLPPAPRRATPRPSASP
ncbi:MAG TPA: ferritin-like domain-containing protein [Streptosporangiaceae bacterium]